MRFVKADLKAAAEHLAQSIAHALAGEKRVLWLVSGGSAIRIAVAARRKLQATDRLVVMQVDERYGPVGHQDSNWQQLLDAGFDTSGINCRPILTGENIAATTRSYSEALAAAVSGADVTIGLFGIGADGHTAGILPGSKAVGSNHLIESYTASDFQRITITSVGIAKLDTAIAYAVGKEKRLALERLKQDVPIAEQPAQALKLVQDAYVYNDYMEGNV